MIVFYIFFNIFLFLLCFLDKQSAKKHKFRYSEDLLLFLSACGGALGFWIGMYVFHHKTKKWLFKFMIPIFAFVHIVIIFWYMGGLL